MQVRVAELRDAEVEPPAVAVGRRRDEAARLEDLQKIRDAGARRAEPIRELARGEAALSTIDEEQEDVESHSRGASNHTCFPHGARR